MWASTLWESEITIDIIVISLRYIDTQRTLMFRRPRFLESWLYRNASIAIMENVGSLNVLAACDLCIPEFFHLPVHCCEVLVDFGVELHQVLVFGWALLFYLLLSKFRGDVSFDAALWPLPHLIICL